MKWKKALADYNLTEETISHGLKKKIKEYREIEAGVNELKNAINDESTPDDELEELQNDLSELEESLGVADNNLVRAVEIFDKNKDRYAEMSKHLGKGRPRKNPLPNTDTNTAKPNPTPTATPTPNPTPNNDGQSVSEPKKKSSFGFVALAVAIGIISLGAVSMLKNRD
jgi:hypothetical protein